MICEMLASPVFVLILILGWRWWCIMGSRKLLILLCCSLKLAL